MLYAVEIRVVRNPEVPDPESAQIFTEATQRGFSCVRDVKVGKVFTFELEAESVKEVEEIVALMCMNLLVNHFIERYEIVSTRPG